MAVGARPGTNHGIGKSRSANVDRPEPVPSHLRPAAPGQSCSARAVNRSTRRSVCWSAWRRSRGRTGTRPGGSATSRNAAQLAHGHGQVASHLLIHDLERGDRVGGEPFPPPGLAFFRVPHEQGARVPVERRWRCWLFTVGQRHQPDHDATEFPGTRRASPSPPSQAGTESPLGCGAGSQPTNRQQRADRIFERFGLSGLPVLGRV
jgi:hypothetical protein